jgi:hypothetical protein
MKLEDVFNTQIEQYDVSFTYKGFEGSITLELIHDMKELYGEDALDKLKSIVDKKINELILPETSRKNGNETL